MNKKFLLVTFIGLLSSILYAGPFGLEKGMNLEQVKTACGGREPIYVDENIYIIIPVKPHPDFVKYIAWIDETEGLYYIKAFGKDIKTNGYGIEIREIFNSVKQTLIKNYGDCEIVDFLLPDSYWDDGDDWMYSISKKERYFFAAWTQKKSTNLPENIEGIYLSVDADSSYAGYVLLEYEFSNNIIVNEKLKKAEADIL